MTGLLSSLRVRRLLRAYLKLVTNLWSKLVTRDALNKGSSVDEAARDMIAGSVNSCSIVEANKQPLRRSLKNIRWYRSQSVGHVTQYCQQRKHSFFILPYILVYKSQNLRQNHAPKVEGGHLHVYVSYVMSLLWFDSIVAPLPLIGCILDFRVI